MDAREFAELTVGLRLSSEQLDMARRVLVGGEPRAAVAADARGTGRVSKVLYGRLQTALDRIMGRKLEKEGVPHNWRVVTVVVPKTVADKVREIARQARADRIDRVITDTSLKGAREVPTPRRRKMPPAAGSPVGGRVGGIRITLGAEGLETAVVKPRKPKAKPKIKSKKTASPKSRAATPKKPTSKKRRAPAAKSPRATRAKKKSARR